MKTIKLFGKSVSLTTILSLFLIGILGTSTTVFAVLYMSKSLTIGFKLKVIGKIGIYKDLACSIPFDSYTFPDFTDGQMTDTKAYIRNEGNVPVLLKWYVDLPTNPNWVFIGGARYEYQQGGKTHWTFYISQNGFWDVGLTKTLNVGAILPDVQIVLGEIDATPDVSYTIVPTFEANSV